MLPSSFVNHRFSNAILVIRKGLCAKLKVYQETHRQYYASDISEGININMTPSFHGVAICAFFFVYNRYACMSFRYLVKRTEYAISNSSLLMFALR